GGSRKGRLRQAARHRLPAECVAPGKRGFTVPVSNWSRKQLHAPVRDALLAQDSLARDRFGEKALRRLLDDHRAGKSDRKEELYALWMLESWRKRFEVQRRGDDGRRAAAPSSPHSRVTMSGL